MIKKKQASFLKSRNIRKFFLCIFLLGFSFFDTSISFAIPAFPGAQGFGSETIGGRGGKVIHVTNLNNTGSGSFRDACRATGSRIVVFDVGGTIILNEDVSIDNPFITIAAQTAPGGICLRRAALCIRTHDVIVRGLRVRPGNEDGGPSLGNRDALKIEGEVDEANPKDYNIIVDHCSFSWSTDEIFSIWTVAKNITISWCIFTEPLNCTSHAYGILLGPGSSHITIHHNLISHTMARSPNIGGGNAIRPELKPASFIEVCNNVIYDWAYEGATIESGIDGKNKGPQLIHFINNYWIKGPLLRNREPSIRAADTHEDSRLYVKGNIGIVRTSLGEPESNIMRSNSQGRYSDSELFGKSFVPVDSYLESYNVVLGLEGKGAGARVPEHDAVDSRAISDVKNRTGVVPNNPSEVGGWPELGGMLKLEDSDNDGMPNSWEVAYGLDPNNSADANLDKDTDGYLNIEEYINGLFDDPAPKDTIGTPENLKIK